MELASLIRRGELPCSSTLRNSDTREEEAIIGYDFAGGYWLASSSPLYCCSSNPADALTRLLVVLEEVFYKSANATPLRPTRLLDLAGIPWGDLTPIANQSTWCVPAWVPFVERLPDAWEQARVKSPFFRPSQTVICHGDLRCANILFSCTQQAQSGYLIDFGLTGPGDPLKDLARIEADLLLRLPVTDYLAILQEVLEAKDWVPLAWETHAEDLLRMLFQIRLLAQRLAKTLGHTRGSTDPFHVYLVYLLHHATRFARLRDPEIVRKPQRLEYLWFTLSLTAKLMGNPPLPPPRQGGPSMIAPTPPSNPSPTHTSSKKPSQQSHGRERPEFSVVTLTVIAVAATPDDERRSELGSGGKRSRNILAA